MRTNSFYPVIMTDSVENDSLFYKDVLGFKETFSADWYVSLRDDFNNELALLNMNHQTIPKGFQNKSSGIILNFEVDDVDQVYQSMLTHSSTKIIMEIRSEDFGQRHFIVEGPSNVLIDIIEVIPPADNYKENYE